MVNIKASSNFEDGKENLYHEIHNFLRLKINFGSKKGQ